MPAPCGWARADGAPVLEGDSSRRDLPGRLQLGSARRSRLGRSRLGGTGGGGGGSSVIQQRAEASCRAEAERQYLSVLNVTPARNQGSYWQTTVHGKLRGHPVAADCRYDPQSNRSSLFVDQGAGSSGGGGTTELKTRAETACLAHAKRVGYAVVGQSAAVVVQNGLTVALQLKQGKALHQASCFYETRSGNTRLDQVRPQPR